MYRLNNTAVQTGYISHISLLKSEKTTDTQQFLCIVIH